MRPIFSLLSTAALLIVTACDKAPVDENPGAPAKDAPSEDPTTTPTNLRGLTLDDFSTCSADLRTNIDTYWFAYSDAREGGRSESKLEQVNGGLKKNGCSLMWSGKVVPSNRGSYAAAGFNLSDSTTLEGFKQLVIAVRGNGDPFRLTFPMQAQLVEGETDFFGTSFRCGDGTVQWVQKTIKLEKSSLMQEGWGLVRKLDLDDVSRVQLRTVSPELTRFNCEIAALVLQK